MLFVHVAVPLALLLSEASAFTNTAGCPAFSFLQGEPLTAEDGFLTAQFNTAIPFAGRLQTSALMHANGFLLLNASTVNGTQTSPPATAAALPYQPLLAVYWDDLVPGVAGVTGNGYLAVYEDCAGVDAAICAAVDAELAERVGVVGFSSRVVLTATYDSLAQFLTLLYIDAQLVVASDSVRTFVFFIYGNIDQGPADDNVLIGMSDGASADLWEMPYSRTENVHLMNTFGNYGHVGCFVFEVSQSLPDELAEPTVAVAGYERCVNSATHALSAEGDCWLVLPSSGNYDTAAGECSDGGHPGMPVNDRLFAQVHHLILATTPELAFVFVGLVQDGGAPEPAGGWQWRVPDAGGSWPSPEELTRWNSAAGEPSNALFIERHTVMERSQSVGFADTASPTLAQPIGIVCQYPAPRRRFVRFGVGVRMSYPPALELQVEVTTRAACARLCHSVPVCLAVSYSASAQVCALHQHEPHDALSTIVAAADFDILLKRMPT